MANEDDLPDPDRRSFLGRGAPDNVGRAVFQSIKRQFTNTLDALDPAGAARQRDTGNTRAAAAARRPRPAVPFVRPPGAVREEDFLAHCTRCGDCAQACPYDCIKEAPPGFREAADTPIIVALQMPCYMCRDTPCISACEPQVLRFEPPLKLATAKIIELACISSAEEPCTVCSDECPIEDVISLVDGRPVIDEDYCTGCGICQYVCPAPHNAIMLRPATDRPAYIPPEHASED